MRSVLVVFESAVAVMLLIAAGLLVRSLIALQNVDPGFDPKNVLTLRVDLSRAKYDTPEKSSNFFGELEQRLGGLPGVETVGFITELPLSGQPNDMPFIVEGRPPASPDQEFGADWRRVNQNYFNALRIPYCAAGVSPSRKSKNLTRSWSLASRSSIAPFRMKSHLANDSLRAFVPSRTRSSALWATFAIARWIEIHTRRCISRLVRAGG